MNLLIGADSQLGKNFKLVLKKTVFLNKKQFNIKNEKDLEKAFRKYKPKLLFNCIGFTDTSLDIKKVKSSIELNGSDLISVINLCNIYKVKLIHFSSNAVFNGIKRKSYIENDLVNPTSSYGLSKFIGERLIQIYSNNYLIFRISSLYSDFQSSGKINKNFIDQLQEGLLKKKVLKIHNQKTNPTHTYDLVIQIKKILNKFNNEIIHCCSKNHTNWYEFAKYIQNNYFNFGKIECLDLKKNNKNEISLNLSMYPSKLVKKNLLVLPSWQSQLKNYLKKRS